MGNLDHRRNFGARVRELRQSQGWTSQESFAHHLSMDRTYVSGIERGTRNPTLDVIVRIAHGLNVPPSALLEGIEQAAAPATHHNPSSSS
ncbi:helix-turn-helix domain-containing protein [Microbacterium stercoris]|uniref:Helix-turn-helix transcriptional regulator n=1 Tax=Microbacterium stercoris TaxID=2820289 RepID=A0A939QIR1_9MICO|nr:helix-turn-helix transcriptional regulator [Microbacterium stercoris]MBO3663652.1 helix-turn-helix transcriptional regulator [Microbacterium stercoris]